MATVITASRNSTTATATGASASVAAPAVAPVIVRAPRPATTGLDRGVLVDVTVRHIRAMVEGDLDDFIALTHPQAVNREALSEPPAARGLGPAAFLATAHWLRTAFSDMSFTIEEILVEGDLVVTHGTMSGRHTGDLVVWTPNGEIERAFAPTGRSFTVNHAHFLRFRDGLVVEHWAVRDDQGLALQAGWIPPTPAFLLRCAIATRRARRAAKAAGTGRA
ncbi:ester cyclase [Parafrankia sp. FMc6]|uniref:ester cyclase n=1 Tax=Parafrankia soli TaxID=2599596 RepID=UPI0034D6DEA3